MTKIYKCMLQFHRKNLVAQFLTRKMTRNRMNENPENWQCALSIVYLIYSKIILRGYITASAMVYTFKDIKHWITYVNPLFFAKCYSFLTKDYSFHCEGKKLFVTFKVHMFWEGDKILRNLHLTCDWHYIEQK